MYKDSNQRTKDYLDTFNQDKVIQNLVGTDSPVIFDIGANVGQTIEKLKKVWPKSTIYSFEPLPDAYEKLTFWSDFWKSVHTYNIALGSKDGTQEFNVSKHQPMLSSFYELNENSRDSIAVNRPEPGHKDFLESSKIQVNVRTLDSFTKEHNIQHIDIIKMDAQGAEPEILENGIDSLKNTRIILTELNFYDLYKKSCSFYDLEKTLIPLGFELFDIAHVSKNPMNGRTDWVEVIYFKKN